MRLTRRKLRQLFIARLPVWFRQELDEAQVQELVQRGAPRCLALREFHERVVILTAGFEQRVPRILWPANEGRAPRATSR